MSTAKIFWDEITKNLTFKDGVFFAGKIPDVSYPTDASNQYFLIEDSSFWFTHRAKAITQLVKNFSPEGMIFDIGGGNGHVAATLEKNSFETVLVEPSVQGILNAKHRGLNRLICATLDSAQFPQHLLPAVGIFDVLEHIQDDKKFLFSLKEALKSNGMLYLTVPAYQSLWSCEDAHAGHFRRYTLSQLNKLLTSSGFEVVYATYIFSFLPIPIFLFRSLPHTLKLMKPKSANELPKEHKIKNEILATIFEKIFQVEINFISQKKMLSFGGTCLVAARAVNKKLL